MDEYDPNIDLFEKIINAKSFADIGMEEKKILGCFKKIMKDLYYFKEKTLTLQLQLNETNETLQDLKEKYASLQKESTNKSDNNTKKTSSVVKKTFQKYQKIQRIEQVDNGKNKVSNLAEENRNLKDQKDIIEKQTAKFLNKINNQKEIISKLENELSKFSSTENRIDKSVNKINFLNSNLKFAEQQKIRLNFCFIITEKSNQINNFITNLYDALTGNRQTFTRPLILSVLFLLRWRNIKKKNLFSFDQNSLMIFTSNKSFDSKINAIQNAFKSLTCELSNTKKKLVKNIQITQKATQSYNEIENTMNLNQNKYQDLLKQIKFYKLKISELNEEMSLMITAEKFEEKLKHFSLVDLENDKLKSQVSELEETIEEKNNELKKYKEILKRAEIQKEIDLKERKECQKQIESQKTSINLLNVRIENRTKDLLSYERMTNNKNKLLFTNPNPPTDDIQCDFPKQIINPKFLPSTNS